MASFRLLNFAGPSGVARPGIMVRDRVFDLDGTAVNLPSTLAILEDWERCYEMLRNLAEGLDDADGRPVSEVKLLAPILYPPIIYNAAANYVDHQKEMSGGESLDKDSTAPAFFLKSGPHCVIGPDEEIRLPSVSKQVDWEAELAVVIGKPARNVPVERALDYVAGYTIFNDLSARDLGRPPGRRWNIDWFAMKNFDGSGPLGPWIVPAAEIPDPYDISIKLWVNDELMQDSNSYYLFFNIHEQIEYLSRRMTLRPGDVIATGTPSGVGRPRGIFLKPGDTVTIELGGIGRLQNPVVQGD